MCNDTRKKFKGSKTPIAEEQTVANVAAARHHPKQQEGGTRGGNGPVLTEQFHGSILIKNYKFRQAPQLFMYLF